MYTPRVPYSEHEAHSPMGDYAHKLDISRSSHDRRHVFLYPSLNRNSDAQQRQHCVKNTATGTGSAFSRLHPYHGQGRILPPPLPPQRPPRTPPPSHMHHPNNHLLPSRPPPTSTHQLFLPSPPAVHRVTSVSSSSSSLPFRFRYERIGDPSLCIFKLQLPHELVERLDGIVALSEEYAQTCLKHGWKTELYSLTKQDLALREIPGMNRRIQPIFDYITQAIHLLYVGYNNSSKNMSVVVDKNQPHILKYSVDSGHTGGRW